MISDLRDLNKYNPSSKVRGCIVLFQFCILMMMQINAHLNTCTSFCSKWSKQKAFNGIIKF